MVAKSTFTANLAWVVTHLWSVAVEFQMYAISPWIISSMCSSINPYKIPMRLFYASTLCNFVIRSVVCPKMFCTADVSSDTECTDWRCGDLFNSVYTQMYTRACPYFLGMIAAYWYENPSKQPKRYVLLEYLCVFCIIFIGVVGDGGEFLGIAGSYIYRNLHR